MSILGCFNKTGKHNLCNPSNTSKLLWATIIGCVRAALKMDIICFGARSGNERTVYGEMLFPSLSSQMSDERLYLNAATSTFDTSFSWALLNSSSILNECDWSEMTCEYAALKGHLAVLQWARANGCPWDKNTCSYAAMRGHMAVLHGQEPTNVTGAS
jgi:hypothetical protein